MGRIATPRVSSSLSDRLDADTRSEAGNGRPGSGRRSTGEIVAEHVRQLVFDGVLRPGDRIPQGALALELGVSRLPVREAVIELARDGLVTVTPHAGAFVGPFDAGVLREHFEIVGLVQGLAARDLCNAPDPTALDAMDEALAEIDAAAAADDPVTTHTATMRFLRTLNLAGGSARQQAVLRALARMLPTGFFAEVPGAAEAERLGSHRILDAIRSGDPSAAQRACVEVQRAHGELVVTHQRARGVFAPGV